MISSKHQERRGSTWAPRLCLIVCEFTQDNGKALYVCVCVCLDVSVTQTGENNYVCERVTERLDELMSVQVGKQTVSVKKARPARK